MNTFLRTLCAGIALLSAGSAMAEEHATPQQAQALLGKAVAELEKDGAQKAFAAFNDKNAGFTAQELYVFVFDLNGKYLASGGNPKLVGSSALETTDAEGKPVVKEIIAVAKSKGKGEVDYVWLNRAVNKVEKKHTLLQRVGDYVVAVGYYLN